jgi:CHASE2 domain-containing sensor protein
MQIWYVATAAFGGAIVAGLLGWAKSGEPFMARKFLVTFLSALLAGVGLAVTYLATAEPVTPVILGLAVLAGAGVDNGVNRLTGIKTV